MSHMTNKPTYDNLYHHNMTGAIKNYTDGNTTVDEFIDSVYEVSTLCVVPEVFYELINSRNDYRASCLVNVSEFYKYGWNMTKLEKMYKAYDSMMVLVRVLTSEVA